MDARAARVRQPAVDDWIERTNELDADMDEAWRVLGQARESGRLNPRRAVRDRMRAASDFETILRRLELLHATADAVTGADAGALKAVRAELDEVAGGTFPPITGALLVNLRNIIESLDVVADAQPVEVPAPSLST